MGPLYIGWVLEAVALFQLDKQGDLHDNRGLYQDVQQPRT